LRKAEREAYKSDEFAIAMHLTDFYSEQWRELYDELKSILVTCKERAGQSLVSETLNPI
jgi:hypothetical protein